MVSFIDMCNDLVSFFCYIICQPLIENNLNNCVYIAVFCTLLNHAVKPTFVCRLNMHEHNSTYKIFKQIILQLITRTPIF